MLGNEEKKQLSPDRLISSRVPIRGRIYIYTISEVKNWYARNVGLNKKGPGTASCMYSIAIAKEAHSIDRRTLFPRPSRDLTGKWTSRAVTEKVSNETVSRRIRCCAFLGRIFRRQRCRRALIWTSETKTIARIESGCTFQHGRNCLMR